MSPVRAMVPATLALGLACGSSRAPAPDGERESVRPPSKSKVPKLAELGLSSSIPDGYEGDGVGDGKPAELSSGVVELLASPRARLRPLPEAEGAHRFVCDLVGFRGALFASTVDRLIDTDGARIYRFAEGGWTLAFDWDRGGAPGVTHEVCGQGIARLRVIGDRLFGTDADAPLYGGFGLTDAPFEDYIFTTKPNGAFGELGPDQTPPAETMVLPLAFHAFDVIRFRGALLATGGTANFTGTGPNRFPGGVWVGSLGERLLAPRIAVGTEHRYGVVRATFAHRFRGRLYIGFQNNGARIRWDVGVLDGDPTTSPAPPVRVGRITEDGGWLTRRFESGGGILYWVGSGYRGDKRGNAVYRSTDGIDFEPVALPRGAGQPQDVLILGGRTLVLTTRGVYRDDGRGGFELWAEAPPGDPFGGHDLFCSAPLTVAGDGIFAGGTRRGRVFQLEAAP